MLSTQLAVPFRDRVLKVAFLCREQRSQLGAVWNEAQDVRVLGSGRMVLPSHMAFEGGAQHNFWELHKALADCYLTFGIHDVSEPQFHNVLCCCS